MPERDPLLQYACDLASAYLAAVPARHVATTASRADLLDRLGGPLPDRGLDPRAVIEALVRDADQGLVATAGPRYFGFVTGGALPVTVAADWLAAAWDQNAAMYVMSPAAAVLEDVVAAWILDLAGLPAHASVGFTTGAHMANATCLAAARHEVLRRAGWNVEEDGLQRAPRLTVVAGDHAHVSIVGALRLLGIGASELVRVPVDDQGRIRLDAFDRAMAAVTGPAIVCTQAGNVASGATDPMRGIIASAHARGAWVHVDGAFGLWAASVPDLRAQVDGIEGADSWTTDAHKWLNVPYDSGIAIVAHQAPHRAAMGLQASYLVRGADEERVGMDWVPESSRRARVFPLYALIRTLGREGIADMVRRTCALARRMAGHLRQESGVRVLNEVVLNQVLVRFAAPPGGSDDETTREVIASVQEEGTCWAGGASWFGERVMRISVSNWSTTERDIDVSARAIADSYRRTAGARVAG